jgi:hypothetical protein
MTLKQKFFDIYTSYYKKNNELDKMVEVADDYAIEFANWLFNINKEVLSKQLKEFKKEKGL